MLILAGGDLIYQVTTSEPDILLESFIGCSISLSRGRTIAALMAHPRKVWYENSRYSVMLGGVVIPLLKSSSNH